jgi:hypothetical protein
MTAKVERIPDGCGLRITADGCNVDIPYGVAMAIAEAVRLERPVLTWAALHERVPDDGGNARTVRVPRRDFERLCESVRRTGYALHSDGSMTVGRIRAVPHDGDTVDLCKWVPV